MNLQIENRISEIADRARGRYDEAVAAARKGTQKAAGRITKGKRPVKAVSRFGVKLSGVSHRTVNKLWKRQTRLVEAQIDALAGHLKAAAKAEGLKDLVETQIELIPDNASRFRDEAREAFDIVKGAGSEIRGIVRDTVDEIRNGKPAARKAPAAKTAAPPKPTATPEPAAISEEIAA
jgi:phasin family protein